MQQDPALVGRLMEVQGVRPVVREVLSAQAMAGARYAGRLRLGRIAARTLVVHGSADAVVDPRNARLLAGRITGARLVTFPGAGPPAVRERPGRLRRRRDIVPARALIAVFVIMLAVPS